MAEFAEVWDAIGTAAAAGGDCRVRRRGARPAPSRCGSSAPGRRAPACCASTRSIAGLARKRLWITDAYFVGVPGYMQALRAAVHDGVDVRLLVPGGSDLPLVRSLSRAGYRGLLEGGVRVFEWNGSMVHAKTAVADGLWARVGSTNLNIQSWMGNWELDVAIEDTGFGAEMERMFEADLERSTEVVLTGPDRAPRAGPGTACRRSEGLAGSHGAAAARPHQPGRRRGLPDRQHRGRRPHRPPPARRGRGIDPRRWRACCW